MTAKETYKGTDIFFDKTREVWYYLNDGSEVWDASLKKLKDKMDRFNRSTFKRITVWFHINRYRSGQEKEWKPTYGKFTLTSVDPNWHAFLVEEGKKNAQKESIRYNSYIYLDTPENRKLIAEYEKQSKIAFEADQKKRELSASFERLDGAKLMKDLYGE